jgi:hypothetical protein
MESAKDKSMATDRKTPHCQGCMKATEASCARVVCPNRRPVTANIPDGCTTQGMQSGGSYRVSHPTKE